MNPVNFIDGIASVLHLPPVVVGTWIAMGILIIFGNLGKINPLNRKNTAYG